MIIPYRDDNPWKRPPIITYALIAVNVVIMAIVLHILSTEGKAAVGALYLRYGLLPATLEPQSVNPLPVAAHHRAITLPSGPSYPPPQGNSSPRR